MLDVLVTEVSLQRSGIPSRVRLVEPAGMPQHVRVNLDFEPSIFAGSATQLLKVGHRHRRAAFGHEQERRSAFGLTV